MNRIEQVACHYATFMRCVALIDQNAHWLTKGPNFYGNHLLLERIYDSAVKDSDSANERIIGLFGNEALNLSLQAEIIHKTLHKFANLEPLEAALKAETAFIEVSEKFYETCEREGKLTLGLDDFIMATSSNRENSIYLLKQALAKPKTASARKLILRRLTKRADAVKDPTTQSKLTKIVQVARQLLSFIEAEKNPGFLQDIRNTYMTKGELEHILQECTTCLNRDEFGCVQKIPEMVAKLNDIAERDEFDAIRATIQPILASLG